MTQLIQFNGANLSPQLVELLKTQVAPGATDIELAYFLSYAERSGLDPFTRQIYAIKRKNGDVEKMTIQVGIDGFYMIAAKSPIYKGMETLWCGQDGEWTDVWLKPEPPAAAKTTVFFTNGGHVSAVALWSEYCQKYNNGNLYAMWAKFPTRMLGKCSEAAAVRKAFPANMRASMRRKKCNKRSRSRSRFKMPLFWYPTRTRRAS